MTKERSHSLFGGTTMIWYEDGKIRTDLCDISFIERVWRKWGGYTESEVEALVANMTIEELTDEWLMNEGVDFLKNTSFIEGELICMIKVGEKEWEIEDAEVFEMKQFIAEMD